MNIKKYFIIILLCITNLLAINALDNAYKPANDVICPTKGTCNMNSKNKRCKCWCSHLCGPREKEEGDNPVYVNDDKYGNYCYCKQWDLDNVERCRLKKNQPKN